MSQVRSHDGIMLVIIGIFAFIINMAGMVVAAKIRQCAGYYECQNCHHKYKPTYKELFNGGGITRK